jgi:hypothetical protein
MPVEFYLGTHRPNWLATAGVPLFVSRRTLSPYKRLPRAIAPWALDSGGFTELGMHGRWETTPQQYAGDARRFRDDVGQLRWAAPQDWMCEPSMLKRTGLSVAEHQRLTINNYLELQSIAPDVPWIAVLQGWTESDYKRHVEQYETAGITLSKHEIVGIGTVCRRQATGMAVATIADLSATGIRLHGFGVKIHGLRKCASTISSADSLAWSYGARRRPPMPGHTHKNCANCMPYALAWREKVLASIASGESIQQTRLAI